MNGNNDKRRISRAGCNLGCSLIHNDRAHDCRIRNFSLTGLLVEGVKSFLFDAGDSVAITISGFSFDNGASWIQGEVVRCSNRYAGVKFTAVDFDTLMELKERLYSVWQDDDRLDKEIVRLIRENGSKNRPTGSGGEQDTP